MSIGLGAALRYALVRAIMPKNAIGSSRELYDELYRATDLADSGIPVTPDSAMRLAAFFTCVRVVSEDVASLPLKLYERLDRGRKEVTASEHWLPALLRKPNLFQTGFEFRELQQSHVEISGNFLALKTVVRGEVREILPTSPARWDIKLGNGANGTPADGKVHYKFTWPTGVQTEIPADSVYHVRGLSLDGVTGVSPVGYQRETIGFGLALAKYGAKLFKNGANIAGVLTHPDQMSQPAYDRLKESFEETYAGLDNSHKTILLEEGADFKATGMKADDAQFLQSRKLSRTEICGFFRVPPHFIGDLERATFSNIEQQSLDYVQKGLLPRVTRLEQRMAMSLLPKSMQETHYISHSLEGLLRGDFNSRMQGYQTAILTGWMNRNEARTFENWNRGPDELDEFLVPGNELLAKNLDKNMKTPAPAPAQPSQNDEIDTPKERLRALK